MPCYKIFNKCPDDAIKLRFAWIPLTDLNGKTIWLQLYWEFGEWWEFGFFVLRGSKKKFPTKQDFWDCIKYRVASMY